MRYIFLDESGDIGFGDKSSKFFTITLLVCGVKEETELQRIVKKARQKILKKKLRQVPELKWNNSTDIIRNRILSKIAEIKIEIFTIILDKSKVYDYLREKKHKLYNYLSNLILTECSVDGSFELIVDRSKSKRSLRDDFDRYIRFKLKDTNSNLKIIHQDSKSSGCLQSLDFISGAIFNKYEFGNLDYYNIIKPKIVTEKEFP